MGSNVKISTLISAFLFMIPVSTPMSSQSSAPIGGCVGDAADSTRNYEDATVFLQQQTNVGTFESGVGCDGDPLDC